MKVVIALGGNALGIDPVEQKKNAKLCAKLLLPILESDNEIIITHGNGPQVGLINMAFNEGSKHNKNVYEMQFSECGAMSQAYIAYHLEEAIKNELKQNHSNKHVISILTNVLVSSSDPAFLNPTKPIGPFYTKDEAALLPYPTKEDSGRGYRRVIASPKPIKIIEEEEIKTLSSNNRILICVGGGGIPVIEDDKEIKGIDAVIDKDYASSTLANNINAQMFIILTAVKYAKINFGKSNEQDLHLVHPDKMKEYLLNEEFKAGSMKPKIEAALSFVNKKGRVAIITDIASASKAINEQDGTIIKY